MAFRPMFAGEGLTIGSRAVADFSTIQNLKALYIQRLLETHTPEGRNGTEFRI